MFTAQFTAHRAPPTSRRRGRTFASGLVALAFVAGACGSDDDGDATPATDDVTESVAEVAETDAVAETAADAPADASGAVFDQALADLVPADIREAGVLTLATDPTDPPLEFYDEADELVGAEVDVGAALGIVLGLEVELVPSKFDAIIPGVEAGRFDGALSGFADRVERQELVDCCARIASRPQRVLRGRYKVPRRRCPGARRASIRRWHLPADNTGRSVMDASQRNPRDDAGLAWCRRGDDPAVGEELFALANGMSVQIGGSVVIEDLDKRILAYSTSPTQRIDATRRQGILDRCVSNADCNAAQYLEVLTAEGPVRFPATTTEYARAAVAIRAGQRPLGTIWAIEGPDGLDTAGEGALVEGAGLAATKMLRSHLASRSELDRREAPLRRALDRALSVADFDFWLWHS